MKAQIEAIDKLLYSACIRHSETSLPDGNEVSIMIELTINNTTHELDIEPDMPLLWALRNELGLIGTKFGCGIAACGACTVHVDGRPMRSCVTPVSAVAGSNIRTIEGLAPDGRLTAVQQAWIAHQVPQCGYCQSGMIMAVSAMLENNPEASPDDVKRSIDNVCRCGTYPRVATVINELFHNAAEPATSDTQEETA